VAIFGRPGVRRSNGPCLRPDYTMIFSSQKTTDCSASGWKTRNSRYPVHPGLVCKPQRKAGSPTASAKAYAHPQHSPAGTFWALSATCPEVTWRGSYLEVRTGVRTPRSIPPYRGEALGRWREFNPRAGPSSFVRSAAAALTIAGPRRIIS
jgi:hypothetical protein